MKKNIFFEILPKLSRLKLINKYNNICLYRNKKISNKQYKYFISLIKQYRYLGIFSYKIIKFIKIK